MNGLEPSTFCLGSKGGRLAPARADPAELVRELRAGAVADLERIAEASDARRRTRPVVSRARREREVLLGPVPPRAAEPARAWWRRLLRRRG